MLVHQGNSLIVKAQLPKPVNYKASHHTVYCTQTHADLMLDLGVETRENGRMHVLTIQNRFPSQTPVPEPFIVCEVPLYFDMCRGTSLIRKRHSLGPYSQHVRRVLWWS